MEQLNRIYCKVKDLLLAFMYAAPRNMSCLRCENMNRALAWNLCHYGNEHFLAFSLLHLWVLALPLVICRRKQRNDNMNNELMLLYSRRAWRLSFPSCVLDRPSSTYSKHDKIVLSRIFIFPCCLKTKSKVKTYDYWLPLYPTAPEDVR